MTKADLLLLKSTLERLADLIKLEGQGTEPSGPLASSSDTSVRPYSTESKTPVGGPKTSRKKKEIDYTHPDYAYGQRGKKEAGKTQRGVMSPPAEAPGTRGAWSEHGTPYTDSNL